MSAPVEIPNARFPNANARSAAANRKSEIENWKSTGDALADPPAPALDAALRGMAARKAADLLFVAGWPPMFGVHGEWRAGDGPELSPDAIQAWLDATLTAEQKAEFARQRDVDFSLRVDGTGRFRVNAHRQNQSPAVAIRAIPGTPPHLDALGLPSQARRLAEFANGLVLVTGGTGHGKSTTLAAVLSHLNETRACHIITLEDPVEFEYPRGLAVIEQREIGADSPDFATALRHVLRQKPDIILVGEMRDLETISTALTAAETGHLVLATLHTCNACQALARIIDVFPAAQQSQVRAQIAASLRAVLAQTLIPRLDGAGLSPVVELMFANDAIRRAIRDNETHLLYGMLETGKALGMCTLEQSLAEAVCSGRIDPDAARAAAVYPERYDKLV